MEIALSFLPEICDIGLMENVRPIRMTPFQTRVVAELKELAKLGVPNARKAVKLAQSMDLDAVYPDMNPSECASLLLQLA